MSDFLKDFDSLVVSVDMEEIEPYNNGFAESDRLTYRDELGVSIDKRGDCPTMYICHACDIPPNRCMYFADALKKLADYEDKEEQGLLISLPCKVGDTVYAIFISGVDTVNRVPIYEIFEAEVIHFTQDTFALCVEIITKSGQRSEVTVSEFGETLFFTRSEAEEALAKMGGK